MLKETETEETIDFLSLVEIQLGGTGPLHPPGYAYGSTRTLVTLLRSWIRRFAMIISAWWLRISSKFIGQDFEEIHKSIGQCRN